MRSGRERLAVAAVAIAVTAVRLFRIDSVQTDLYGDIALVLEYVRWILEWRWPFSLQVTTGPLHHYLAVPVILVSGLHYTGLKVASVVVSLGALLAVYALARRLLDDRFALLAVLIAGVSSWLLVFSRLGNVMITAALLAPAALWLALRFVQERRRADLIACAVVSTLGLYTYAAVFVLPAVMLVTLIACRVTGHPITRRDFWMFTGVSMAAALPFLLSVTDDLDLLAGPFFAGKLRGGDNLTSVLIGNAVNAALAFHVRGDAIFRSNPGGLAHLDPLSGVLFLIGIVFWLRPNGRRLAPVLLVPFVLLQLPSMLVLRHPEQVPSAARTLAAAPVAYILVASGVWWIYDYLAMTVRRRALAVAVSVAGVAVIGGLNLHRYFHTYVEGLPYHDTSIGREIAAYSDGLSDDEFVYIVGERWVADMPEVPFVRLAARHPERILRLDPAHVDCDALDTLKTPAVLIWSFKQVHPAAHMESCAARLPAILHASGKGLPVFHAAPLLSADPAGLRSADGPSGSR
jgi:4-amino-4-deoxy-L-arabinose transferase-like glycosyltransferase